MTTWEGDAPPPPAPVGLAGWISVALRGPLLAAAVYGGLLVLLLLRLVERPFWGQARPLSPYVTVAVCRLALAILGISSRRIGRPMAARGAVVANHASWLDIFVLNAVRPVYFVAKSEVAGWPGIGWLAKATGTVFIARDPKEAKAQQILFEERLRAGHRLVFFPEGTSTDGQRVLGFKSTLFAAFFTHGMEHTMHIQPVTLRYAAPGGRDARFFGWWGGMDFAPHLLQVLARGSGGRVEVIHHPPVAVDSFEGRKALALHCERAVRHGMIHGAPWAGG